MGKRSSALSGVQRDDLFRTLQARFEQHPTRHPGVSWQAVRTRLDAAGDKLWSLWRMEQTGGEPDVVNLAECPQEFLFVDCAGESPAGRRSLCYDGAALEARKQNKPAGAALLLAAEMGVEILTEQQYRALQTFEAFDTKTSSWIRTPPEVRELGGALFCDRRYNTVFTYHNGAESYYAVRGVRASLRV
jgi:hypothetical protein